MGVGVGVGWGGEEDQGVQSEDKFVQSKQRKVGKLQGLHLPKECKGAKGQLASLKSPRIREGIAMGGYKTCKGGGRKFPEEDTSHLHIQYSTPT